MTEVNHQSAGAWTPTTPTPLESCEEFAKPALRMSELQNWAEAARTAPYMTLGRALQDLHLLDGQRVREAINHSAKVSRDDEASLIASGSVTPWDLEHAHAHMMHTPEIDAERFQVEAEALERLPWTTAQKYQVLPLGFENGILFVASPTPFDRMQAAKIAMLADCNVSMVWGAAAEIAQRLSLETHAIAALSSAHPTHGDGSTVSNEPGQRDVHSLLTDALLEIRSTHDQEEFSEAVESSSVIQLVNRMILDAYEQKASDIHIETNPGDADSRIRFRKDGDLEDYLTLPHTLRAALVSRIKIMSRLDISERRRPQDGKINFHDFSDIKLELRVAVLPTHDNLEDVVMRLLATSKPIPLQSLGFSHRDEKIIKRLCERQFGLILACGPTGSGKTTTLHSLLAHINTDNRKIWTAEDPIEITQKGLRQLQVNPKIGVTFASAMRAFLRADPDVIMIGEVRDPETASVCIEASLTGHLVFSTLHTNSAAESVIRLLDLGMDPMNFGDSLVGIVAQRLVRALCKNCAHPVPCSQDMLQTLVQEYVEGTTLSIEEGSRRLLAASQEGANNAGPQIYQAVGCPQCNGRGYKGRMGIYELLENVGEMKSKIQARAPTAEIFAQACRSGMRTLRQDALEKMVQGHIDLAQARTVY